MISRETHQSLTESFVKDSRLSDLAIPFFLIFVLTFLQTSEVASEPEASIYLLGSVLSFMLTVITIIVIRIWKKVSDTEPPFTYSFLVSLYKWMLYGLIIGAWMGI